MEQEKGLVKVGELTEPMVDVISQVMANCLDPSGNINKELTLGARGYITSGYIVI